MRDAADSLASTIEDTDGLLLVVTGAGVSSASGIPTFRGRDPGAVWKVSDTELATWEYFQRDPVGQWKWYLDRFRAVDSARPNPAHDALVELERWQTNRGADFLLVTQNIDTLHEEAGSSKLIKVHGTSDRLRCTRPGCNRAAPAGSLARRRTDIDAFRSDPGPETLPRCPECRQLLRAHVLFFDEYYQEHHDYRFDEVLAAGDATDLLLFVGTSFSVGITDLLLQAATRRRVPVFSIDPGGSQAPRFFRVTAVEQPAETVLPAIVDRLTR